MLKALSATLAIVLLLFALPQSSQDLKVSAKGAPEVRPDDEEEADAESEVITPVVIAEFRERRIAAKLRKTDENEFFMNRAVPAGGVFKLHLRPKLKDAKILAYAFAKDFSIKTRGRENFSSAAIRDNWGRERETDEAGLVWTEIEEEAPWRRNEIPKGVLEVLLSNKAIPRSAKKVNIEGKLFVKVSKGLKTITVLEVETFDIGAILFEDKASGLRIELASLGKGSISFDLFGERSKLISVKLVDEEKESNSYAREEQESDFINLSLRRDAESSNKLVAEIGGEEEIRTYNIKIRGYELP